MKKLVVFMIILFSITGTRQLAAQVHINVNIGSQPVWGPVGYDYVDYYYLPDYDAYYYVPRHQFIYLEGNRWAFGASLPLRFGRVDLYNTYKVVINEPRPYLRGDDYRERYGRYRGWGGERQLIIRDSRDDRYRRGREENDDHDNGRGHAYGRYKNGKHEKDNDDDQR